MSTWMAGNIEKQLKERPTAMTVGYAAVGLVAMAAATPTGALVSLAGALMGALMTAIPTKFNYKMSSGEARLHIAASAAVGALAPFAAVAYGAYQTFKVGKLFSRRSEKQQRSAPDSSAKPR